MERACSFHTNKLFFVHHAWRIIKYFMKHTLIVLLFILIELPLFAGEVLKFDFGSGKTMKGYTRVDQKSVYTPEKGFGFDKTDAPKAERYTKDPLLGDACCSDKAFFFSVKLPEGDYRIKLILGNAEKSSTTYIRAESRRLFFENQRTSAGEFKTVSFTTNIRNTQINNEEFVKIKPRENGKADWDEKLTLEFNGSAPSVCALEIEPINNAITVFLCGNSTVVDQDNEPWCGWGQMIPRFFDDRVSIANYAESGESANTFMNAGRLKKLMTKIKPGDYVFIEFGHNDQKQTGPNIGPFTSYKENLRKYIQQTREKQAIPVLVTPVNRRSFDENGQIVNTLKEYPDAVRQLASEEKVTLIDLNAMSKVLYEVWGPEKSIKAFVHYPANTFPNQPTPLADNTHFNAYGGYEIAKCVVHGICTSLPELAVYLRSDVQTFNPANPDPVESFYMPPSPFVELQKPDGN